MRHRSGNGDDSLIFDPPTDLLAGGSTTTPINMMPEPFFKKRKSALFIAVFILMSLSIALYEILISTSWTYAVFYRDPCEPSSWHDYCTCSGYSGLYDKSHSLQASSGPTQQCSDFRSRTVYFGSSEDRGYLEKTFLEMGYTVLETLDKSTSVHHLFWRVKDPEFFTEYCDFNTHYKSVVEANGVSGRCYNVRSVGFSTLYLIEPKSSLSETIRRHFDSMSPSLQQLLPKSYDLANRTQNEEFFAALPCKFEGPDPEWIFKPYGSWWWTSGGKGIDVYNDNDLIRSKFELKEKDKCGLKRFFKLSPSDVEVVSQEFVVPYLFHGRTHHMRYIVLIANADPLIVLSWDFFVVRLGSQKYNSKSPSDGSMISNTQSFNKEVITWAREDLESYMMKEEGDPTFVADLMAGIRKDLKEWFTILKPEIARGVDPEVVTYQILGLDFMIDKNKKAKMIEMNIRPGFGYWFNAHRCAAANVCESGSDMFKGLISITEDILQRKLDNRGFSDLDTRGWETIVNEDSE